MQRSLNEVYRKGVYSAKGKRIGRVHQVLFDAADPRVVGYVVEQKRLLWLFDRKDRHLARDCALFTPEGLRLTGGKGAWDRAAARRLGIDWDVTVVWSGMPVCAGTGEPIGTVRDGLFDDESGQLAALGLSEGGAADIALGTRDVPARFVLGFSDGCVRVTDEALEVDASGGVAQAAGKGAAVARVQAEQAVTTATQATKTAIEYGKSAARVAARSETGKKAVGWLKSMRDEIKDAMGDPDDD